MVTDEKVKQLLDRTTALEKRVDELEQENEELGQENQELLKEQRLGSKIRWYEWPHTLTSAEWYCEFCEIVLMYLVYNIKQYVIR